MHTRTCASTEMCTHTNVQIHIPGKYMCFPCTFSFCHLNVYYSVGQQRFFFHSVSFLCWSCLCCAVFPSLSLLLILCSLFFLCVCVCVCNVAAHSSRSDSKDDLISFLFLSCSHRDLYFCVSVFTTKIPVIWMRWVLKFSNLWWCCCLLFFGVCLRWGVQDRGTLLARGLRRWLYCLELRHYDYASYGMGVCRKSRPKEAVHRRV